MRIIGLIVLLTVVFTWAEEAPPPPRTMHIYMKDGTIENIACGRIDPTVGVTFVQNGMKMKVGLSVLFDPIYGTIITPRYDRFFATSLIDSITFTLDNPPAEVVPEVVPEGEAALSKHSAQK